MSSGSIYGINPDRLAFTKEYIERNRPAVFDWMVICISFLLGFIFPTLSDFIRSPDFYTWILVSFLVYTAGAALKDGPLSQRLSFSSEGPRPVPYVIFLAVGHWFIFFFLLILAEPLIRQLLGLAPLTPDNTANPAMLALCSVWAGCLTWLVYRRKTNRPFRKKRSASSLYRQEIVADILLTASVSVITFIFWEKGALAMLGNMQKASIGAIVFQFLLLAILFILVYLPLRYLYFIEDRGHPGRRLLQVFAFLLIRALLDMLQI